MEIKERPILFNADMVRAILDGRKTQTRREVKHQSAYANWKSVTRVSDSEYLTRMLPGADEGSFVLQREPGELLDLMWQPIGCPFGKPGDRLWVRETFGIVPRTAYAQSVGVDQIIKPDCDHDAAIYRAGFDRSHGGIRWRPSIHMPRWACRILLEITAVRVERLQDISEADAKAEGADQIGIETGSVQESGSPIEIGSYSANFSDLWQSVYGPDNWAANPWVWVIEFRRI